MPLTPFAQVQMSIAGGGVVTGGQVVAGGQTVQLSGVNTSAWNSQLWEIPAFPAAFATPAGWTLVNGVLQSTAVQPPIFTLATAAAGWGKYLFRLTVNGGFLNGVLMGPLSAQPLIDVASGVHVLSPKGQHDIALGEGAQFNAITQWIGEYQANLRIIESQLGTGGGASIPRNNPIVEKGASYTLVSTTDYQVVFTGAGPWTATLPASPTAGDTYVVTNESSANATVAGNGNTILPAGAATIAPGASIMFVKSTSANWVAS